MSGFGEDISNIPPRYYDLKAHYCYNINKYGPSRKLTDDVRYLAMHFFFWKKKHDKTQEYDDYLDAIGAEDYDGSDRRLNHWLFVNRERRNFFIYYLVYADAYNTFIAEKIEAGIPVHRVMDLGEALDIADTGRFTDLMDYSPEEINTKPFFFAPDLDLEMSNTVILTMPATAMPFQAIWATPYLRRSRTIKSGQTIQYDDLKQQEVRLDLADPKATKIPDHIRPKLMVKKHINLTKYDIHTLERRFDVRVIL